jgi:modulator of FtsH protease HflK
MSARKWLAAAVVVATIGYLFTGLTIIAQDEVGVLRRLGAVSPEPWLPGMHLGFPFGIDRVDRIKRDEARTIRVGAAGLESAPMSRGPDTDSDDFLTGDLNLVTAEAQVQFRIVKPEDYLFAARSPDAALAAAAESALARALATRAIDDVLTTGRSEVSEQLRREVQKQADDQRLGVMIRDVRLGRVTPPAAVAPAFADAARARGDQRQNVTKAEEYRDRALADARGQAREIADRSAGAFDLQIQRARGEADRFTSLLVEVQKNPFAARQRLYLEMLADVLPRFTRKVVVPRGETVDLSIFTDPGP